MRLDTWKMFAIAAVVLIGACNAASVRSTKTDSVKMRKSPPAEQQRRAQHGRVNNDDRLVEFLIGFGEGLDSDFGNVTVCARDLNLTLDVLDKAFVDVEYGIDHLKLDRVEKGLREFGDGLLEIVVAMRACGFIEMADDIEAIAKDISAGIFGIAELIVKEAVNIFWHEKDLTAWFHDASKYWAAGNYKQSGFYTGKIVGLFLEG